MSSKSSTVRASSSRMPLAHALAHARFWCLRLTSLLTGLPPSRTNYKNQLNGTQLHKLHLKQRISYRALAPSSMKSVRAAPESQIVQMRTTTNLMKTASNFPIRDVLNLHAHGDARNSYKPSIDCPSFLFGTALESTDKSSMDEKY